MAGSSLNLFWGQKRMERFGTIRGSSEGKLARLHAGRLSLVSSLRSLICFTLDFSSTNRSCSSLSWFNCGSPSNAIVVFWVYSFYESVRRKLVSTGTPWVDTPKTSFRMANQTANDLFLTIIFVIHQIVRLPMGTFSQVIVTMGFKSLSSRQQRNASYERSIIKLLIASGTTSRIKVQVNYGPAFAGAAGVTCRSASISAFAGDEICIASCLSLSAFATELGGGGYSLSWSFCAFKAANRLRW